jgi:hypothetical protein
LTSRSRDVRFHVDVGPKELFERVRSVMGGRRGLTPTREHFPRRAVQRGVPDEVADFDSREWELMTAEVDPRKGKFTSSSWRRRIGGQVWWIVIGLHDVLETAYPAPHRTGRWWPMWCGPRTRCSPRSHG